MATVLLHPDVETKLQRLPNDIEARVRSKLEDAGENPERQLKPLKGREECPVQYAVLYGSHAHGGASVGSDIDLAIVFAKSLSESEQFDCRIELIVALMETLGTDHVDLADLDTIRPEVGLQALETGQTLIEDREIQQKYRYRRWPVQTASRPVRRNRYPPVPRRQTFITQHEQ